MNPRIEGAPDFGSAGNALDAIWRDTLDRLALAYEDGMAALDCLARVCRELVGAGGGARALAATRLRAGLSDRWGLRDVLSPHDGLPRDPIHDGLPCDDGQEPSSRDLAVVGWHAAAREPFRSILENAFEASSKLLLDDPDPRLARRPHPLRLGAGPDGRRCGDCAWRRRGRCLQVSPPWDGPSRVVPSWPACARWEPVLTDSDCAPCGACCREGYSLAPVRRGEAMLEAHPEWIQGKGARACLPRPGGRCVALSGDGSAEAPWRCRDYAVRPRACSGLAVGSNGCLEARRRTGLSAG